MKERIFPRKGTNKDLFERLVEYISYFDKDWINKIEGATDKEIEKLENIFKRIEKDFKLPEQLYIFLKNIGKNNGNLLFSWDCYYCNIDDIINFNKMYITNIYLGNYSNIDYIIFSKGDLGCNYLVLNKDGIIISIGVDYSCEIDKDFILKSLIEEDNKEIFIFPTNDDDELLEYYNYWKNRIKEMKENKKFEEFKEEAIKTNFFEPSKDNFKFKTNSIETLLFQLAFRKYEKFSNSIDFEIKPYYNIGKNMKEIVENVLKNYNTKKAWFSDEKGYYGYGNEFSIYIYFYPGVSRIYCFITSENKEIIKQVHSDLQKAFK